MLFSGKRNPFSRKRLFSVKNIPLAAAPWRCTILYGNLKCDLIARYGTSAHAGNNSPEALEGLTCC